MMWVSATVYGSLAEMNCISSEKAKRLNNLQEALSTQNSVMSERDQKLKNLKDGLVQRFGGGNPMSGGTNRATSTT